MTLISAYIISTNIYNSASRCNVGSKPKRNK